MGFSNQLDFHFPSPSWIKRLQLKTMRSSKGKTTKRGENGRTPPGYVLFQKAGDCSEHSGASFYQKYLKFQEIISVWRLFPPGKSPLPEHINEYPGEERHGVPGYQWPHSLGLHTIEASHLPLSDFYFPFSFMFLIDLEFLTRNHEA